MFIVDFFDKVGKSECISSRNVHFICAVYRREGCHSDNKDRVKLYNESRSGKDKGGRPVAMASPQIFENCSVILRKSIYKKKYFIYATQNSYLTPPHVKLT